MLVQTSPPPPRWLDYFNLIFNLISQAPDFIYMYKHFSHNKIHILLQEKYITSCGSACFTKKKTHPPPPSLGTNSSLGPLHTHPSPPTHQWPSSKVFWTRVWSQLNVHAHSFANRQRTQGPDVYIFPYSTCSYVEN